MKHRFIALILILTLLTLSATAETPAPATTPAPLKDDGRLAVWLKSLDAPAALHLTFEGVYTLESSAGFRFERGAQVALTAASGDIWLKTDALALNLGPALTLTRHAAPEGAPNGLYIAESEKPNLYPGDLSLTVVGDGLRAVLTLPVEEYLPGVVAYEMSDSFPLEALKAQAVAARTYALGRKQAAGRRDYDLVDTTADQVYKGTDPDYENVALAVQETRGIVGTYKGSYATCYYTASNGGQTALASQLWGKSDADAYLAMTDDPYDLENPSSLQTDLTFTATCEGSQKLRRMLTDALNDVMAKQGYDEWRLDSIRSIEPVNPRFEGSKLYDGLAFDLTVMVPESALATPSPSPSPTPKASPVQGEVARSAGGVDSASPVQGEVARSAGGVDSVSPVQGEVARSAGGVDSASPAQGEVARSAGGVDSASPAQQAPTATPALPAPADLPPVPERWMPLDTPQRVTLGVFDDIKDGLSMGLNGADCELISVERPEDAPDSFRIVMRRYGHGVGMSQRGAEQMAAQHGKTFREILKFYYPGMTLTTLDLPETRLTDVDDLPAAVAQSRPPPPPPPPPPRPQVRRALRRGHRLLPQRPPAAHHPEPRGRYPRPGPKAHRLHQTRRRRLGRRPYRRHRGIREGRIPEEELEIRNWELGII